MSHFELRPTGVAAACLAFFASLAVLGVIGSVMDGSGWLALNWLGIALVLAGRLRSPSIMYMNGNIVIYQFLRLRPIVLRADQVEAIQLPKRTDGFYTIKVRAGGRRYRIPFVWMYSGSEQKQSRLLRASDDYIREQVRLLARESGVVIDDHFQR